MSFAQKLSPKSRAWLKTFHVIFISGWLGAACCMILLQFASSPNGGDETYATNMALKLIDDFIIIPTAMGSLITGLLISWLTPWGFFKWQWVTVKWVITLAIILTGTFALGPWLNSMVDISGSERLAALTNSTYINNRQMLTLFSFPQLAGLILMVVLSIIKPWNKKKKDAIRLK